MTPSSQRPYRSNLLRRLMQLLLLQDLVASLQLRTHLHRGLWHPGEDQSLHLSERPVDRPERKTEHLGHADLQCACSWNPLQPQKRVGQTWITE